MSVITCPVCPHACRLALGEVGSCGARQAKEGKVVPLNYGRCTSLALDPIEKKPLARYHPGALILSYGSFGCNLCCSFCQNWQIAHICSPQEGQDISSFLAPETLVEQAQAHKRQGNIGIALTYNEPLICPEYLLDVAPLAHAQDLKIVLVTNGYVMPEVAQQVFSQVDAVNIDLKAFNQGFYDQVGAPAGLSTVKRSIQTAFDAGCHVEVTTLIIPGLNDSTEEMASEASWLASLSPNIPLHLSRFRPAYKMMDTPPTPRATILELQSIALEHLSYVYTGNM